MNSSLFLHLDSPIIYVETLEDDLLGVLCENSQLYLLDKNTQEIFAQYNIAKISLKKNCAVLSKNALYFAYVQEYPKQLNVIDLVSQRLIHSISTHRHEIENLRFDTHSKYIIAGTKTGRVFLFSTASSTHIARLSSFPEYSKNLLPPKENFISVIQTYKDWCITSGYGGSIVITNLQTQFRTKRIHSNFTRVSSICMLDSNTLICSSDDGVIEKISLKDTHEHQRINTSIRDINRILLLSDKEHVLISNSSSQIALLEIKTLKVVDTNYINSTSIIVDICVDQDDTLYLGLQNAQVLIYALNPLQKFEKQINMGHFEEAYALANSAIILKSSEQFKLLERKFLETYHQAQEALLLDHKVYAHKLLKSFIKVPSKAKVIHNLFYAMQHYPRLTYLLAQKKYPAAYTLVESYQPLQLTPSYKKMQKQFENAFDKAQIYIVKKEYAKAKNILAPFATVAQKSPLIHLIVNSPTSILSFSSAMHKKEYAVLSNLSNSYPILKTLTSYIKFEEKCNTLIESFLLHVKNSEIKEAQLLLDEIKQIPRFHDKVKPLQKLLKEANTFYQHYEKKSFLHCFVCMDRTESIAILPLVQELNEEWKELMQDCEELALKGDIITIKAIILDLINLESRETKIANFLRLAYHVQIANTFNTHHEVDIHLGFENYLNIFGIDTELLDLLEEAKERGFQLSIKKSLTTRKPRNSWFLYKEILPDYIYVKT